MVRFPLAQLGLAGFLLAACGGSAGYVLPVDTPLIPFQAPSDEEIEAGHGDDLDELMKKPDEEEAAEGETSASDED